MKVTRDSGSGMAFGNPGAQAVPEERIRAQADLIDRVREAVQSVFVGKDEIVHVLIAGFISGLHVMIEDVPGVGKTTLARTLAAAVGLDFARIQFTPDLLPGDITGVTVWSQEKRDFVYKQGAIMHQFVLADEINRASPRTQSSLLEAMQERTVSVDGRSYELPQPFFVVATQNPSEFVGTFPLPEGEMDRFGLSFSIGYPHRSEERQILNRFRNEDPLAELSAVAGPQEVVAIRGMVREVFVSAAVQDYIVEITRSTRQNPHVRLGASPRATQHLQLAAQAQALMSGRGFVVPEDVLSLAGAVLAHRIVLSNQARMEQKSAREVVDSLVGESPIPVGMKL